MVLVWGSVYSNNIGSNLICEPVVLRAHLAGKERTLSFGCCTEVIVVRAMSRMGAKSQVYLFVCFFFVIVTGARSLYVALTDLELTV